MLVFQSPERAGEKPACVADLLFTRDQFQEMARIMGGSVAKLLFREF